MRGVSKQILRIIYDDALFPPGTDSFLLGDFARTRPGELVCDLGSGTGLIGLLLQAVLVPSVVILLRRLLVKQ